MPRVRSRPESRSAQAVTADLEPTPTAGRSRLHAARLAGAVLELGQLAPQPGLAGALRRVEEETGRRFADVGETARALNLLAEAYLLDTFGGEPRVSTETALQTLSEIWVALVRP